MVQEVKSENRDVEFTDVDLNDNATTEVYNPGKEAHVYFVKMENTGSTAQAQLELTDGSSTAVLTTTQSAGDDIAWTVGMALGPDDKLQVNVTTVEGSALAGTVAVSRGEQTYTA